MATPKSSAAITASNDKTAKPVRETTSKFLSLRTEIRLDILSHLSLNEALQARLVNTQLQKDAEDVITSGRTSISSDGVANIDFEPLLYIIFRKQQVTTDTIQRPIPELELCQCDNSVGPPHLFLADKWMNMYATTPPTEQVRLTLGWASYYPKSAVIFTSHWSDVDKQSEKKGVTIGDLQEATQRMMDQLVTKPGHISRPPRRNGDFSKRSVFLHGT